MVSHGYIRAMAWDAPFEILASELTDGINAAKREGAEKIRVRGYKESHIPQRLSFDALAGENCIRSVTIANDVKVLRLDPEGLYEAQNLRELAYDSVKVKLDFSRLSRLEVLYAKYNENFENFDALTNLRDLLVTSAKTEDCGFLGTAAKLRRLRLNGGTQRSLAGIAGCRNLEQVGIDHLNRLADIDELGQLPELVELSVEACRNVSDYSALAGARKLTKLEVRGPLDSLAFIRELPNLEKLYFDNLIDADFDPMLESDSLRFGPRYPSKRHYPMTLDKLQGLLDEKHA